jgi:hypothetical protein
VRVNADLQKNVVRVQDDSGPSFRQLNFVASRVSFSAQIVCSQ